jgi:hypothetical protein
MNVLRSASLSRFYGESAPVFLILISILVKFFGTDWEMMPQTISPHLLARSLDLPACTYKECITTHESTNHLDDDKNSNNDKNNCDSMKK